MTGRGLFVLFVSPFGYYTLEGDWQSLTCLSSNILGNLQIDMYTQGAR